MTKLILIVSISLITVTACFSTGESVSSANNLDDQVRQFLDSHRRSWRDMNVPEADGQALHDLILKHGYKNALEIGTSTGYSGIWMA